MIANALAWFSIAWLLASLLAVTFMYCASCVSGNAENADRDI